jgi:hypothetical protein
VPLLKQVGSIKQLKYDSPEYWQVRNALQLVYDQDPGAARGNHANLCYVVHLVTGFWYDKQAAIRAAQILTGD